MLSCLTLTLALALPAADDPKAVVEKAVKAHGGADLLAKYKGYKAPFRGTVFAMGMEIELKGEILNLYPDKAKVTGTLTVGGMDLPLVQVVNGSKLSMSIGGNALPVPDEQAADAVASMYVQSLTRLTPLVTADYTLKPADGLEVDGKKAVGVLVSHKDKPDVTLHFDAESGVLVRSSRKGRGEDGGEAERVTVYADYKAAGGVQMPHRTTVTLGGNKSSESAIEKYEMLETVDAGLFGTD